jgi:hypothetical protein
MSRSAVKSEETRPEDQAKVDAWLEGLAGRAGTGEAARDGQRLRNALNTSADELAAISAPPWHHVQKTAGLPAAIAAPGLAGEAANEGRWRRWAAAGMLVLGLAVGATYWSLTWPDNAASGSMRGAPSAAGAAWRTDKPHDAARLLAAELESAGARVKVTLMGSGSILEISCEPDACRRVNVRLARLETAVDAHGRLALVVLPPR